MNILSKLWGTETPIIGVVHLSPLPGYDGFEGKDKTLQRAIADVEAFERGGISAIMIENNYDLPHQIEVGPEIVSMMTFIISRISKRTRLPIGVSVLWNDYRSALAIALATSAAFIRIPVFVDRVRTDFGEIRGNPEEVIAYRQKIGAQEIALFTDIQVKHAELLEEKSITISAKEALTAGADGIIVTGKWTGEAPAIAKLKEVREAIGDFPLLIGSGATTENIQELLRFANGAIVSTSLKTGSKRSFTEERNIKSFQERIDTQEVRKLMEVCKKIKPQGRR